MLSWESVNATYGQREKLCLNTFAIFKCSSNLSYCALQITTGFFLFPISKREGNCHSLVWSENRVKKTVIFSRFFSLGLVTIGRYLQTSSYDSSAIFRLDTYNITYKLIVLFEPSLSRKKYQCAIFTRGVDIYSRSIVYLQLNFHVLVIKYLSRVVVLPTNWGLFYCWTQRKQISQKFQESLVSSGKFSMQISEAIHFPCLVNVSQHLSKGIESISFCNN